MAASRHTLALPPAEIDSRAHAGGQHWTATAALSHHTYRFQLGQCVREFTLAVRLYVCVRQIESAYAAVGALTARLMELCAAALGLPLSTFAQAYELPSLDCTLR
jgi:hypothetical protein